MEQLNRLTRSLRRARTVELPEGEAPGERAPHFSEGGWRPGEARGRCRRGRGRAALWGSVRAEMPAGTGPHRERVRWRLARARARAGDALGLLKLQSEVGELVFILNTGRSSVLAVDKGGCQPPDGYLRSSVGVVGIPAVGLPASII